MIDGLTQEWFDGDISLFGAEMIVPGVRVTLWLAGGIIVGAGLLASWSLRAGTGAFLSAPPEGKAETADEAAEPDSAAPVATAREPGAHADTVAEAIARETEDVEA